MRSKQEAATARAAAAQRDDARSRLSGLEVERQGYVARGDDEGIDAVDEEISRYRVLAELDEDETPTLEVEPVDLDGLAPEEVFEVLGVPAEVIAEFTAAITAKVEAEQTAAPGESPVVPADADKPAEPTGRRGRAKAAAAPAPADVPADDAATAGD